jgi:hypothetical protein
MASNFSSQPRCSTAKMIALLTGVVAVIVAILALISAFRLGRRFPFSQDVLLDRRKPMPWFSDSTAFPFIVSGYGDIPISVPWETRDNVIISPIDPPPRSRATTIPPNFYHNM